MTSSSGSKLDLFCKKMSKHAKHVSQLNAKKTFVLPFDALRRCRSTPEDIIPLPGRGSTHHITAGEFMAYRRTLLPPTGIGVVRIEPRIEKPGVSVWANQSVNPRTRQSAHASTSHATKTKSNRSSSLPWSLAHDPDHLHVAGGLRAMLDMVVILRQKS